MDESRERQKVGQMELRRKELLGKLLRPYSMIGGYLYPMYKKCGRRGCRCEKGEKHGPYWCVSSYRDGKWGLVSVGKGDLVEVRMRTDRYREYQKMMAELRKLHFEVWGIIKRIRDKRIEKYQ